MCTVIERSFFALREAIWQQIIDYRIRTVLPRLKSIVAIYQNMYWPPNKRSTMRSGMKALLTFALSKHSKNLLWLSISKLL